MRDLHFSTALAGISWSFFGIGATLGSFCSGFLGDKMGIKNGHIVVLALKTLSVIIATFSDHFILLNISIFLMGFSTTGNVALTNAMALKIVSKDHFASSSVVLTFILGYFKQYFLLFLHIY